MIVTQDEARALRLQKLRNHGSQPKYFHSIIGGNFRLDAIQAAVVHTKFRYLNSWTEKRQAHARDYTEAFRSAKLEAVEGFQLPSSGSGRHVFNQYVIRTPRRDVLKQFLKDRNIETEIYYPLPFHLQECFQSLGYQKGNFPESEKAAETSLALPVYPELSDKQKHWVIQSVCDFFHHRTKE